MKKQLSILLPLFEYKKGITEILDSIIYLDLSLKQKIEIILSDDSLNPLFEENDLNYYRSFDLDIIYISNKIRKGAINNWNFLISQSSGEYQWLLHHDEAIYNHKIFFLNLFNLINKYQPDLIVLDLIVERILFNKLKLVYSHTPHRFLIYFLIRLKWPILFINYIGSPSCLIVKRNNTYIFDNKLQWLVDVNTYFNLFLSDLKNIQYFNNFGSIISHTDFRSSITQSIKDDIPYISSTELKSILMKYKIPKINKFYIIIFKFLYKIYRISRIRISLCKFIW